MLSFPNLLPDPLHPPIPAACRVVPRGTFGIPAHHTEGELTGVTGGQRLIEFLPVMIHRAGVVIASEVIRGMPELSCNPVSLHLRLRFPSLIHCPLLLVIPGANEEAVIDPRGQRPLCSARPYRSRSGFKTKTAQVWNSCCGPASSSVHSPLFVFPSEESWSRASRDESEVVGSGEGGGGALAPPGARSLRLSIILLVFWVGRASGTAGEAVSIAA